MGKVVERNALIFARRIDREENTSLHVLDKIRFPIPDNFPYSYRVNHTYVASSRMHARMRR